MNILITGASGFIGTYVYKELNKKHNIFRILSSAKKTTCNNDIVANLEKSESVNIVLNNLPSEVKIDVVIHLAAKLSSKKNIDNNNALFDNIMITENVAKIAISACPNKIIHFSSASIYPNITGIFNEQSLPTPQENTDCLYGLSKLCSEAIFDYLLKNAITEITHLRIGQVYGDGMREDRIIPTMLNELKEKNIITVFGDGERTSNFIEVNELAKIIPIFIDKSYPGIYNIGSEDKNYYDLAKDLINKHGNEKSNIVIKKSGNNSKFNLDLSKLNSIKKIYYGNNE